MKRNVDPRFRRRAFLRTMARTALAAPLVIPASALRAAGRPAASERIVIGHMSKCLVP